MLLAILMASYFKVIIYCAHMHDNKKTKSGLRKTYRNCAENVENYVKKYRGSLHQHLLCRKLTKECCKYIKKKIEGLHKESTVNA